MRQTTLFSIVLLALGLTLGCAHVQTVSDATSTARKPANTRPYNLPDQTRWQPLYDYADNLDISNPSITLTLSKGGTSVYGVINIAGKPIGAIIPENSSASVSGETFAFTLSRALGYADIYQAGIYHFLTGEELTAFMAMVPKDVMKGSARENNRQTILKRYAQHPEGFDAVYKNWEAKPHDYEAIGSSGTIDVSHILPGSRTPVASFLQCDGPRPNPGVTVTINGGTNNELEVSKELSTILLIDALTQQWDRFSGGNLQTVLRNGRSTFVAYDNGGTWGGTRATEKNLAMVTRFDANVAQQILAMDDFFAHRVPSYLGLTTEDQFLVAFDIVKAPKAFAKFKASLTMVAAHIRAHNGCTF